ncbi:MAG: hypothetical protein OEW77_00710 [Gemmatimonadota bacterium]|nr:hypothetical protein [Gemmatimonadota bacterium]
MARPVRAVLTLALVLAPFATFVACGEPEAGATVEPTGHVLSDAKSGVALDLPPVWVGRYRISDKVSVPASGLERELTLRFVRADSSIEEQPLLTIRVFARMAWDSIAPKGSDVRFGIRVAENDTHALALAMAAGNPLPVGTADALGYDTLMISLNQRPLRAWMRRDSISAPPGPGAPATSSP